MGHARATAVRSTLVLGLLLVTGTLGSAGCIYQHRYPVIQAPVHRPGPPAHAPAHGYSRKAGHVREARHEKVDLVFDSGLGVHVVVGHPATYWYADRYLRWASGTWQVSTRVDGGWTTIRYDAVPAKLVAKHDKHARHHRKAHRKH